MVTMKDALAARKVKSDRKLALIRKMIQEPSTQHTQTDERTGPDLENVANDDRSTAGNENGRESVHLSSHLANTVQ